MNDTYKDIQWLTRVAVLEKYPTAPPQCVFFYHFHGVVYGATCNLTYVFHYKDSDGTIHSHTSRDQILNIIKKDHLKKMKAKYPGLMKIRAGDVIIADVKTVPRWHGKKGVVKNISYRTGGVVIYQVTVDLEGVGIATLFPREIILQHDNTNSPVSNG